MQKTLLFLCIIANTTTSFSQRDTSLPWVGGDVIKPSCYPAVKKTITELTGYVFEEHPLKWVKKEIAQNLSKTDTTYDDSARLRKVYYYSKTGNIIQIISTRTDRTEGYYRTKIYDENNNLIFWENINETNTIMRIRRGYDEYSKLLFECTYWAEVSIMRLNIFSDGKPPVKYNFPCNCDF